MAVVSLSKKLEYLLHTCLFIIIIICLFLYQHILYQGPKGIAKTIDRIGLRCYEARDAEHRGQSNRQE